MGDWGIHEHFELRQLLKLLGEYDQCDFANISAAELAFRRIQTIEFGYLEVLREAEANVAGKGHGKASRLTIEEQTILSGQARSSGNLMICPALLEHARAETEKESGLLRNLQKAREGREALRKKG